MDLLSSRKLQHTSLYVINDGTHTANIIDLTPCLIPRHIRNSRYPKRQRYPIQMIAANHSSSITHYQIATSLNPEMTFFNRSNSRHIQPIDTYIVGNVTSLSTRRLNHPCRSSVLIQTGIFALDEQFRLVILSLENGYSLTWSSPNLLALPSWTSS